MTKLKEKSNIIGLKELRNNIETYIKRVNNGESFTVVKRSEPVFKITSVDEDESQWETIVDFTKIKKGGIKIEELLSHLNK